MLLNILHMLLWMQTATNSPEMADALRSSGKIYVVVACVLIIFIGIALFLLTLERRLKRLESE